jgi:hypothetical protein
MSTTATDVAVVTFKISLGLGQLMWKQNAVNCVLQNRPFRLVLSGSHAVAVGDALKVPLPSITWKHTQMSATLVIVIAIMTVLTTQGLVDVLNVAFGRGYHVNVRWKRKGPGAVDDELIFELIP